ncbi:glycosyltransferase family 39 protein [Dyella choica]|nr:glycosyltransferase family 39 protein [Dyella choica]
MHKLIKNWRYLTVISMIFVIGAALRLHLPDIHRQLNVGDETTYNYAALDIVKYGTLTREIAGEMYRGEKPVEPSSWMSPGYPLFLAAVYKLGGTQSTVFALQIALSIGTLAMIYYLLILLELRKVAVVVAMAVAAVYPGFIYNIDRLLTEHVFVAFFLAYAIFMTRAVTRRHLVDLAFAGIFLVLAIHVRSHAAPFVAVSLALILANGKNHASKLRQCVAFLMPIGILMIPWWIRNLEDFHRFILLSEGGTGAKTWGDTPYFIDMSSTADKTLNEVLSVNRGADSGVFYRWHIFGFIQYMWGDVWDEWIVHPIKSLRPFLVLQIAVVVPTIMAIPLLVRRASLGVLFACSVPILFTLMNMPFHGLPRYVYPSLPFVFVVFGALVDRAVNHVQRARNQATENQGMKLVFAAGVRLDRMIRLSAVFVTTVMSLLVGYSVYVFSAHENTEMSHYRLARYMGVHELPSGEALMLETFSAKDFTVESARGRPCGPDICYQNNGAAPSILRLDVRQIATDQPVVTAVTIDSKGGYIFDYTTVYWTAKGIPPFSEDHVYRFPTSSWTTSKTIYIDSDVSSLLIVPYVFRRDSFSMSDIKVSKFAVKKNAKN